MKQINIKAFVNSYLETAAWCDAETGENKEFTREAKKTALADCLQFIEGVKAKFGESEAIRLLTIPGNDLDYLAPHCFYLNRNGHGSGFWDREIEYEEAANILSDISKGMGSSQAIHIRGPKSKLTFG